MSADLPPLTPAPDTPKQLLNKKLLTVAVLAAVAVQGYALYAKLTHKSPEHRFADAIVQNPALQKALSTSAAQALRALTSEAACPQQATAPLIYAARAANLSEENTSRKLKHHLEHVTTRALLDAFEGNPLVAQEAAKVSADLGKVTRLTVAAANKKLETEDPDYMRVSAKDGLMEATILPEAAYRAAELHACVRDARMYALAQELYSSMADAYDAMRKTAYSAAPGESDLFARMPATDMPKLAAGVQRWQSAGDFVLLAELPVTESALCDQINATAAQPLPAWALQDATTPVPGATRWSCSKYADKIVVRHDGALQSLVPAR